MLTLPNVIGPRRPDIQGSFAQPGRKEDYIPGIPYCTSWHPPGAVGWVSFIIMSYKDCFPKDKITTKIQSIAQPRSKLDIVMSVVIFRLPPVEVLLICLLMEYAGIGTIIRFFFWTLICDWSHGISVILYHMDFSFIPNLLSYWIVNNLRMTKDFSLIPHGVLVF